MKKIITIMLVLCMIITCFACTKSDDKKVVTTGAPDNTTTPGTTPPVTTTQEPKPGDHIPDADFKGADFRINVRPFPLEVFSDSESTDICDVAVYNRNCYVEDTYNVTLVNIASAAGMGIQVGEIASMALSDIDFCDIALPYCMDSTSLIVQGCLQNWKNFEYTDFSQPYWMSDINSKFMIRDAIYSVVGELCTSTITYSYAVYYNRTKGENLKQGLSEEIFDVVREGDWTYDYFYDLIDDYYQDIDDEIGKSEGDFYGFVAEANTGVDNYMYAWDLPSIVNDPDTGLNFDSFYSEKLVKAADMLYKIYYDNPATYIHPSNNPQITFAEGNALFCTTMLTYSFSVFRDMEDDYTILPYPKYDDSQTKYMTGCMDNYSVIVTPITAKNVEMISVITEALNYKSWLEVYPAFQEDALKRKYSRDPETIEMLDYLFEGRNFDISYLLSRNIYACYLLRFTIQERTNNIKALYDANIESYSEALRLIMERYDAWSGAVN